MLLLLLDGKFGEVASCAAQSRRRPGFEFDAGNRVDLANQGICGCSLGGSGLCPCARLISKNSDPSTRIGMGGS